MDFSEFVNKIYPMTCVISVESKDGKSYGDIRIVTGNKAYIDSIEIVDENAPAMLTSKFVPNSLYQTYFPKDLNFEDFCFRCAVLKKPMHTYVHPERFDFWFDLTMLPLGSEGNIHYCTYTQVLTKEADAEQMSNISSSTATSVLNTCIKLRGTKDFQATMGDVISDIRKICDAESCVILLTDEHKRECNVLCESIKETSKLPSMEEVVDENFYDITEIWNDMIGGSNGLIVKNEQDLEYVHKKNPDWYASLQNAGVDSIVLFPLKSNDEILGYIWASNFDTENTVKIKEVIELTIFFIASELDNFMLLDKLRVLSTMDMLTGVLNRNEMNNKVDKMRKEGAELVYNIGIVFADLNGLKRVNDNEGHAAGDLLLKNGAIVLQNAFIGDVIFRAGGDEFMIILTDTNEDDIKTKCAKVKELSKNYDNVSFALGYSYSKDSSNITDDLKLADERMYEDKAAFYKEHPELKR